jgi:hypothetical protein
VEDRIDAENSHAEKRFPGSASRLTGVSRQRPRTSAL